MPEPAPRADSVHAVKQPCLILLLKIIIDSSHKEINNKFSTCKDRIKNQLNREPYNLASSSGLF